MFTEGRFIWIGDGNNRKSLLFKGDAARAWMAVASSPAAAADTRKPGIGLSRNLSMLPNWRLSGIHQTVKKWMAEDVYDRRLFNHAFGFSVQTSMNEGIRKEVAWYLREGVKAGAYGVNFILTKK